MDDRGDRDRGDRALTILVFPLLGIASLSATAAPYGADVIFLFLGGFVLAAAIQRWGLDRRIAYLALRLTGTRPDHMIGGVMVATAFLSMWVSNTATAAMMVPIARSMIDLILAHERAGGASLRDTNPHNFAAAILLSIAYAASIGGIGTIIGSPPNGILVRFVEQAYQREISFVQWMAIGVPVMLMLLPVTWWLLTRVLFRAQLPSLACGRQWIDTQWRGLGPVSRGERVTLVVFAVTALAWITRPLLAGIDIAGTRPLAGLSDAGIAVAAALALFLLPIERGRYAMDWATAQHIPWGVLILFGGGLSLAAAVEATGVTQFIASHTSALGTWAPLAVLVVVVTVTVFLSELTSNTAQVATMVPLLAGIAPGLGIDPLLLIVPCTLAASCAFMLPVGTPPNAIVFGTGLLTISQMCSAGFWLNLIGIALITTIGYVWIPLLFGLR